MDPFITFTIVIVVLMPINLGLMLFAEYWKLDELESYFSENERARYHKRFWGRNRRIDRFQRMGLMIDFLSNSKHFLKTGVVTEEELARVPLSLKRWALWPYRTGYVLFAAAIAWGVWYRW